MSRLFSWAPACAGVALFLVFQAQAGRQFPGIGRTAAPAESAPWDSDERPPCKGIPPGPAGEARGRRQRGARAAARPGPTAAPSSDTDG